MFICWICINTHILGSFIVRTGPIELLLLVGGLSWIEDTSEWNSLHKKCQYLFHTPFVRSAWSPWVIIVPSYYVHLVNQSWYQTYVGILLLFFWVSLDQWNWKASLLFCFFGAENRPNVCCLYWPTFRPNTNVHRKGPILFCCRGEITRF